MKKILFYVMVLILGCPIVYCQTKKKTSKKSRTASVNSSSIKGEATISFASYGSGIDADSYGKVKQYLDTQGLKYSEKPMGREGEVDISVDFTDRSDEQKKKIADFFRSLHNPEKLVRVEIK